MATEYRLSYTAAEINEKLGKLTVVSPKIKALPMSVRF